jgi:hypothetical protein
VQITFNFPNVFVPSASALDNALALRALLNCMIELNVAYLKHHNVPLLYDSGVRYGRTHIWEPIAALYLPNKILQGRYWFPEGHTGGAKIGDCKSLGTARVAELRIRGKRAEPTFRFAKKWDGGLMFHILVQGPDGWEDPSKRLGMPSSELRMFE